MREKNISLPERAPSSVMAYSEKSINSRASYSS